MLFQMSTNLFRGMTHELLLLLTSVSVNTEVGESYFPHHYVADQVSITVHLHLTE